MMSTGGKLMGLAFALVSGEIAGFACERFASLWPWALAVMVLAFAIVWGWQIPRALAVMVFFVGMVSALKVEDERLGALQRHWASAANGEAPVLEVTVESTAVRRLWHKRGYVAEFPSHCAHTPLKVVLSAEGLATLPASGEVWRLRGWVARSSVSGGKFARRMFWAKSGERVKKSVQPRILRAKEKFAAWGNECARRSALGLGWCPDLCALNQAILLGRRADISHSRRQIFVAAGTVHVFAISGLHVMLLAWMLLRVFAFLGIKEKTAGLWIVPVLVAYTMLTLSRPSAVRATMMAAIYLLSASVGRRGDSLAAWAITALVVYGISPEKVYDTGCTLSFVVMLGIVLWLKWCYDVFPRMKTGGKAKARDGELAESFGVTCAAWASSVPIAACLFGRFTLGGLIANVAIIKLAPLTVAFGMLGVFAGFVWAPLAVLFNNFAAASTFLMCALSTLVASLPYASIEVAPWPLGACFAWYLAIVGALLLARGLILRHRNYWWQ